MLFAPALAYTWIAGEFVTIEADGTITLLRELRLQTIVEGLGCDRQSGAPVG
jgi:hypothetical protein